MPEEQISYRLHLTRIGENEAVDAAIFTQPDSIDAQNQYNMYEVIRPIVETAQDDLWLTIGDLARSDAHMLRKYGCTSVIASDLVSQSAETLLQRDNPFVAMNAEALPLADKSVDYILCKESYHHFPRPPVALYEMIRVARKGVVLIEPQAERPRLLDALKRLAKIVLRGRASGTTEYESSGNYIYRMNYADIYRAGVALNLPAMAWKPFNTFFISRFKAAPYRRFSVLTHTFELGVGVQDLFGRLRLMDFGMAVGIIFCAEPAEETIERMRVSGMNAIHLPRNPYWR